jgi:TonB-linked SusC/RagA family outer membrane protein
MYLKKKLFLFFMLCLSTISYSQSKDKTITISFTNISLSDAMQRIEKSCSYTFFYDAKKIDLNQKVSLNATNMPIKQALTELFSTTSNSFEITNSQIALFQSKPIQSTNSEPAKSKRITGLVTDENGNPIIGASIRIKGTSIGTITDVKGKFNLDVLSNSILQISYLGFSSKEIQVSSNPNFNIVLNENTKLLEDVVVIGYGSVNRKDLTGSVATVKIEDIQQNPVASFKEALGGRVAGVQVTSLSGRPGDAVDIVIRGGNSVTQSNSPLYVVDGFPLTEDNGASLISPEDIESISILKDASATAIYGARGANGVIMITTKKGVRGKPSVQYNGYYGIQQTDAKINVLDPYDFVKLQCEIYPTSGTENYLTTRKMTMEDYKNIPMVNWQDHLFQQAAIQNHYVSVSGQTDKTLYSVSASYFNQSGVIVTSGSKRYTARMNLEQRLSDIFKMGFTSSFSDGIISGSNPDSQSSNLLYTMWSTRPFVYNSESLTQLENPVNSDATDLRANPIANLQDTKISNTTISLSGNAFVEYTPINGLKLRITGGVTSLNLNNSTFYGPRTQTARFTANGVSGKISETNNLSYLNENTLTYSTTIKKIHKINAVGGFTMSGRTFTGNNFGATNLPYPTLELNSLVDGIATKVVSSAGEWKLMSFLGRANYSYKSKYLVTASFRFDGSSKFIDTNRWAFFPSGSLAWVASEEHFMKSIKNTIDNLKFRTSWGRTGNNNVLDFASRGQFISNGKIYPFGGLTTNPAMVLTQMDNIALKWETTEQLDAGMEFSMLKGRIKVELDYYKKNTFDLLLNSYLPTSSGYLTAAKNIGNVQNQGWEFTLNTINIKSKSFEWNSSFNISTNNNKVMALADGQRSMTSTLTLFTGVPAYIAMIGQPLGLMYGYISDGLLQESDFYKDASGNYTVMPNVPIDRPSVKPGFMKFEDLNHDGKIDANDRTIIGNANPKFIGGFNNNIKWKNFDMTFYFQWSYGNDILNGNKYAYTAVNMLNSNGSTDLLRRWTLTNTDTDVPVAGSQRTNTNYNSWMVEDGSYFRFKSLQLGYTFPNRIVKLLGINKIRVYSTLNNIFVLTNYSGFDPEVSTQFSNMTRGFDYSSYPRSLSAVFGLNVNF